MKKVFFLFLAMSMLASTASFAGGRKKAKKDKAKMECTKTCPRGGNCCSK